ncbi:MAG: hypothetical protein NC314_08255 [Roseburia sp.]|nr:hypothetical protein [Roseburia sp.]MCM1242817.1 hypothetical protein [Roseburia sp.]
MIITIAVIFFAFFVISVIVDRSNNIKFQKKLNDQNLNIILVNHDEMDIKAEFFKESAFFKLNNTGKSPSEISKIKFVRYSTDEDYFIRIR